MAPRQGASVLASARCVTARSCPAGGSR